jgi:hypothetical protein
MKITDPTSRRLLVLGMACLALGNTTQFFVRSRHLLAPDAGDGLFGLLMGVGIGLTLLALRRSRCRTGA